MTDLQTVINLEELIPYLFPREGEFREEEPLPRASDALRSQKARPFDLCYENESLLLRLKWDDGILCLSGQCHAIFTDGKNNYLIEEELVLERKEDFCYPLRDRALFRAKMLSLALCNTKNLPGCQIRLSIFSQGEIETQDFYLKKEELSQCLQNYADQIFALSPLWNKSLAPIEFPYKPLRPGQKQLIKAVWNAIKEKNKLYACAPTGIGKTLAVLYPALKALESKKIDRVYYASPKNTLKLQAAVAVEKLQPAGTLRTLVFSAKMALCPSHEEECERDRCEYAWDFHKKLPEALSYLSTFSLVTEAELSRAAELFTICPFELALHYQKYCQVIIGDYNHIFDANRALFHPGKNSILLVDEAHNLPGRIRENYTQTLCPEDVDFFFQNPSHTCLMLREQLAPLLTEFAHIKKAQAESKNFHSFTLSPSLVNMTKDLLPKVAFALHRGFGDPDPEVAEKIKEFYGKLKRFVFLATDFNRSYAVIFPPEGGVRLYLVDPREKIRRFCKPWRSVTFFSATLAPRDYYFDLLAGEEEDTFLSLPSPFPPENLFVGLIDVDVSYHQRFLTAPKICSIIQSAIGARPGNYMVFLPSFDYLRLVVQEFKKKNFHIHILVQEKVMSRKMRNDFLNAFRENRSGTLVGFCVMGGIFAEGVDLQGEALVGEIIVGTGFPPPSPEAQAEAEAYYQREMDGKSFAYTLPGWSRVLQAAGRLIRSESDRGFLILCDRRYLGEDMKELFPEHWEGAVLIERETQLKEELSRFWQ